MHFVMKPWWGSIASSLWWQTANQNLFRLHFLCSNADLTTAKLNHLNSYSISSMINVLDNCSCHVVSYICELLLRDRWVCPSPSAGVKGKRATDSSTRALINATSEFYSSILSQYYISGWRLAADGTMSLVRKNIPNSWDFLLSVQSVMCMYQYLSTYRVITIATMLKKIKIFHV